MSKIMLSIILLTCSFKTFSKAKEFETARLFSTAGTGVGSILMDEATILNPAPLAFFNLTSVFLQKSFGGYIEDDSPLSGTKADNLAAIISDARGPLKGSISYIRQNDGLNQRQRISIATAFPIAQKSGIGLTARRTTDKISKDGENYVKDTYYQFVLGAFHALNQYFSAGLVIVDPLRTRPEDVKAVLGMQLVYGEFISAMVDFGANWEKPFDQTFMYRGAVQFMVFKDLYLRGGLYKDKGTNEKGNGVGIGWVSPKLALELAMKNSDVNYIVEDGEQTDKKRETSFSASYRF